MSVEIKVPEIAESVNEATVGKWHKEVGDAVNAGELLLELETEKVMIEVTATAAGSLDKIVKESGANVVVGDLLGTIKEGKGGKKAVKPEPQPEPAQEQAAEPSAEAAPEPAAPVEQEAPEREPEPDAAAAPAAALATPVAQNLAKSSGIALETLAGTGPGGRITKTDVEMAIAERTAMTESETVAERPAEEIVPLSRRRLTIARRMAEVQRESVMTTTYNEVDMTQVIELRNRYKDYFKDRYGVGLGFMSFFFKAATVALKEFPILNSELRGDNLVYKYTYNIGVAIASNDGLVVPVIRDVDRKSFADLEKSVVLLRDKTLAGKLTLNDFEGGTFTITNGGVFGSMFSTPILNPPQVGIMGMHAIKERAMVVNGEIQVKPMMYLAVTYDHRIVEGADAVRFLVKVKEHIESPSLLLIDF